MPEVIIKIPPAFKCIWEKHRYKVFKGGRGSGKCLGLGTKVLMFDGSLKNVEDIMIGDQVMGADSLPRNVLSTTHGIGKLYKVKQTSGMDYIVNEDHILSLKKRKMSLADFGVMPSGNMRRPNGKYPNYPKIVNMRVEEVASKSRTWKMSFRGYKAGLLNFPRRAVTIDPYYLGVWLGDGTSQGTGITSMDSEIIDYCEKYCSRFGLRKSVYEDIKKQHGKARSIGFVKDKHILRNPLFQLMKDYNLIENKHIPEDYIVNDEETRLQLLAGLLDTDGYMYGNCYEICQSKEHLARGIKRVADSLGFKTSIKWKKTVCSNNGKVGKCWRVVISGNAHRIPCLLSRKKIHADDVKPNKDFLLSQIDIEPMGVGEYAGFSLDGDHLFCLEDGTVTHNSESVARYLLLRGMENPLKIVCGREFQSSIKESVYDMLTSFIDNYGLESFYKVLKTEIIGVNGTTFSFVGLHHNIASIKSMFDVNIFWGEEAQTFSANSLTVLLPTIRAEGSELIFTMNPELEEDPSYQMLVVSPPPDTVVTTVNYMDNPYFPESLRILMEHDKSKDYQKYLNVWEGRCKAAIEGAIFAKELQKATEEKRITDVPYEKTKPVDLHFDLGRSDLTSIWFHQQVGFENRLLRYYENGGEHFSHYIQFIKSLPYAYGTIYLPHDAENELLSSTKTIKQQAIDAFPGQRIVVIPRIPQKALAIDAARGMMDTCYFDKTNCADGLSHLRKYHYRTDPETGRVSKEPEHDVHSNCADSFMSVGQARIPERKKLEKKNKSIYVGY